MKKIIAILLCACLLLTGCGESQSYSGDNMFVVVQSNWTYKVVYHKDTKVMYTISCDKDNGGYFTLLVNPDGSPMLYKESEE